MAIYVFLFVVLTYFVLSVNCRAVENADGKLNFTRSTANERTVHSSRGRATLADRNNYQESRKFDATGKETNTTKLFCSMTKDHQRCLVSALSRIARVRLANDSREPNSKVFEHQPNSSFRSGSSGKRFDIGRDMSTTKSKLESHRYRCHAVRDVYMPEVATKLPAYACKFEDKAFVLTSTRFLEDRRSYVDVDFDLETYQRMSSLQKNLSDSQIKVVPAVLVLKVRENNYKIRIPERKINDKKSEGIH